MTSRKYHKLSNLNRNKSTGPLGCNSRGSVKIPKLPTLVEIHQSPVLFSLVCGLLPRMDTPTRLLRVQLIPKLKPLGYTKSHAARVAELLCSVALQLSKRVCTSTTNPPTR